MGSGSEVGSGGGRDHAAWEDKAVRDPERREAVRSQARAATSLSDSRREP